jgi:hypothetical protein
MDTSNFPELPSDMMWGRDSAGPLIRWTIPKPHNHFAWVEERKSTTVYVLHTETEYPMPDDATEADIAQLMAALAWTL